MRLTRLERITLRSGVSVTLLESGLLNCLGNLERTTRYQLRHSPLGDR
jgi:hypothetical protein